MRGWCGWCSEKRESSLLDQGSAKASLGAKEGGARISRTWKEHPIQRNSLLCPWVGQWQVVSAADTAREGTAEQDEATEVRRSWNMPDLAGHRGRVGYYPKHNGKLPTNARSSIYDLQKMFGHKLYSKVSTFSYW